MDARTKPTLPGSGVRRAVLFQKGSFHDSAELGLLAREFAG